MEILHGQAKTLKIHDLYPIPLEVLVTNHALTGGQLMWVDGVLFSFAGFQQIDEIVLDQMKGKYQWVLLEYNLDLKNYQPTLKAEKLNREVPVFNMSYHPFYQQVATYIAKNHDKHKSK